MGHIFFHKQHTLKKEVRCEGTGLHSGLDIALRLKPAPENFGVRFRRLDLPERPTVVARYDEVTDTSLATTIGSNGATVSTIEHLMAAFVGMGVDNVLVELTGPEVPILDGSAAGYFKLIQKSGLKKQGAYRHYFKVERPFTVREGDAFIKAIPSDQFEVCYTIEFPHPLIGRQEFSWCFEKSAFARDIAKARTFGFLKDVQQLQRMGLARGGSLENAIVFDDRGLLNDEGFRYPDECVRHKVLDFMGDVALAGKPLLGRFEVHKAGHKLHNQFLETLMNRKDFCSLVVPMPYIPPVFQHHNPLPSFVGNFALSPKAV